MIITYTKIYCQFPFVIRTYKYSNIYIFHSYKNKLFSSKLKKRYTICITL